MALDLEFDRSLLDKEHRTGPFEVTRDLIQGFCSAIGETNPLFTDEQAAKVAGYPSLLAPPTLCTIFSREVTVPDIKLKFGRTRFHAGQMVETLAPIVAGDSLMASSYLKDVYPKTGRSGTMVFIVWQTSFTNHRGENVAEVRETYAARE